jgi:CheY-like chemotaxis protein
MGAGVQAHSGGLGRGSEVVLRFAPAAPQAVASTPAGEGQPAAGRPLRILVVEDSPDVRESLIEYLSLLRGHQVESAGDGWAGLDMARRWGPEVVLCDVGLPKLDGYELARQARQIPALRDTVLVAVTGYGSDADRARSLAAGFDHHLTKPVDLDALDRLLAQLAIRPPAARGQASA